MVPGNYVDFTSTYQCHGDEGLKAKYYLELELLLMESDKVKEFAKVYKEYYGKYLFKEKK